MEEGGKNINIIIRRIDNKLKMKLIEIDNLWLIDRNTFRCSMFDNCFELLYRRIGMRYDLSMIRIFLIRLYEETHEITKISFDVISRSNVMSSKL